MIPPRSLDRLDDDTIVRAYLEPKRAKRPKRPWWAKWLQWLSDLWDDA